MNHLRKSVRACIAIVAGVVILIVIIYTIRLSKTPESISVPDQPDSVPLKLILHAKNSDGSQTYLQGEPLNIAVFLQDERFSGKMTSMEDSNDAGKWERKPVTVGTEQYPWFRGLTIHVQRIVNEVDGVMKKVPLLEDLDWATKMIIPRPGAHINNQPSYHSLTCVFAIDPDTSQSLTPGRYIFEANWDGAKPPARDMDIWHGTVKAQSVETVIVPVRTDEEAGRVAFACASHYINQGDIDSGLKQALRAEELCPSYKQWGCYDMAARAYQRKGDIKSAAKYYRKFVDAHKDTNPDRYPYILKVRHRLERLEKELDDSP